MNRALNRSSTPGTEPLCIIRFIAESGYSALQINCGGLADGCRRSQRREWTPFVAAIYSRYFRDAATQVLPCARLVASGSDAEDYRDFMSGSALGTLQANALRRLRTTGPSMQTSRTYAAVLAADEAAANKAGGLCRIGLLLSIARRGRRPSVPGGPLLNG